MAVTQIENARGAGIGRELLNYSILGWGNQKSGLSRSMDTCTPESRKWASTESVGKWSAD